MKVHNLVAYVQKPTLGADKFFYDEGFILTQAPERADFLVLCGGSDINPHLYGETRIPGVYCDDHRDLVELDLINEFKGVKPFVGICRGAQLLNVIAGGKLWQDVNNHGGNPHPVYWKDGSVAGRTNSVHHQMMRPGPNADILLYASEATSLRAAHDQIVTEKGARQDPECIVYKDLRFLCFQPHPEFGHLTTSKIFMDIFRPWAKENIPGMKAAT